MLLLIWTAALTGITLKTIFFAGVTESLGLVFYLALGWLGALSGAALWRRYGLSFIKSLLWGGVAYTVGAVIDFLRWPVLVPCIFGSHEAFHVAILIGAILHWKFVWQFASGQEDRNYEPSALAKSTHNSCPLGRADSLPDFQLPEQDANHQHWG